mmetsp:Transcript_16834/g.23401  ORF Transcript_16834/g.23401 Transcript_16834/m.23401 type:complete len:251 (-) Transcript_16834:114-866(-)
MGDAHFSFKVDSDKNNFTLKSSTEEMVEYYTHGASPRGVEGFDQQQSASSSSNENAQAMVTQIHNYADFFISTVTKYTVIFTQHHGRTKIHLNDLKKSLELFSRADMKPSNDVSISELLRDETGGVDEDETLEWTETSEDIQQVRADDEIEIQDQSCYSGGEVTDVDEDETPVATIIRSINFSLPVGDTTCIEEDASKGISLDKIHTMCDDSVLKEFQSVLSIRNEKRFFPIVKVFMDAYIRAMIVSSQD